MSLRLMLGLVFVTAVECADLPLACTPTKPVVGEGESVEVKAWPPPGHWDFEWSSATGQVDARGRNAIWDLTGAPGGEHTIRVGATRQGADHLTCDARVFVEGQTTARGDRFSRRFLLVSGRTEPKEYGLYSYIVLTPPGADKDAKERNRKVLETWKSKVLQMTALERKESKARLNGIFVPVDRTADDPDVAWIEQHYDYSRADHLLLNVPGIRTSGPYLISSLHPLTGRVIKRRLILDASWAPSSTIEFWFSEFTNQAAQERFDVPGTFDLFNLKLRTIVGVLAEGLPHAREALASIMTVGK